MSAPPVVDAELARSLPTVSPYSTGLNSSMFSMEQCFPEIDLDFRPFGTRIVVQLRRVIKKSAGGILLGTETTATEAWNMQVGKVLSIGPLAFKNRRTGEAWPEGLWCKEGDYVRFSRHVGDRLSVQVDDDGEPVALLILNDSDLIGQYLGDPREVRAYLL